MFRNYTEEIESLKKKIKKLEEGQTLIFLKKCPECKHLTCHINDYSLSHLPIGICLTPSIKRERCLNCGKLWKCEKHCETVEVKEEIK